MSYQPLLHDEVKKEEDESADVSGFSYVSDSPPYVPPVNISVAVVSIVSLICVTILIILSTQGDSEAISLGWFSVFTAIFIWGSYSLMIKSSEVRDAKVDPMEFQVFLSLGVGCTSVLLAMIPPWEWLSSFQLSIWPFCSAFAWILTQIFFFNAVTHLGYALAPAISNSLTMIVSFIWGAVVFQQNVVDLRLAFFALFLLCTGITLAVLSTTTLPLRIASWLVKGDNKIISLMKEEKEKEKVTLSGVSSLSFGGLNAVLLGLVNGSLMIFLNIYKNEHPNLEGYSLAISFMLCFAIGIFVTTPIVFVLYFYTPINCGGKQHPQLLFKICAKAGIITGMNWTVGYYCAVFATLILGETIGYPLTQICCVVNGLWGIFLFREFVAAQIIFFVIAVFTIISGAMLLGIFG